MKIAVYLRNFSNQKTLNRQKEAIAAYEKDNAATTVERFYEDVSSESYQGKELLRAVKFCITQGLLLVIGISGNLRRSETFLEILKRSGVDFYCCDDPGLTCSSIDNYIQWAKQNSKKISSGTKRSHRRSQGSPHFNKIRSSDFKRANAKRKENADLFALNIIRQFFDLHPSDKNPSISKIVNFLNDRSIPTRNGGTWSHTQVKRIKERCQSILEEQKKKR